MEELAQLNLTTVEGIGDETLKKLKKQASLQLEKIQTGNPKYQFKSITHGKGFYRIPQAHPQDIFFDLEGDPTTDGGHEYLFGYVLDGNFTALWSTDLSEERDRFQEIMEFFKDHLLANPQAHIYHYNHYETTALKRMTLKYDVALIFLTFCFEMRHLLIYIPSFESRSSPRRRVYQLRTWRSFTCKIEPPSSPAGRTA